MILSYGWQKAMKQLQKSGGRANFLIVDNFCHDFPDFNVRIACNLVIAPSGFPQRTDELRAAFGTVSAILFSM